jgi:hypothetical protein
MGDGVSPGRLDDVTGDFLPRRRQASARAQLLTVLVLIAAASLGIYLYNS